MVKKKVVVKDNLMQAIEYLNYTGPIFIRMTTTLDTGNHTGNPVVEASLLS